MSLKIKLLQQWHLPHQPLLTITNWSIYFKPVWKWKRRGNMSAIEQYMAWMLFKLFSKYIFLNVINKISKHDCYLALITTHSQLLCWYNIKNRERDRVQCKKTWRCEGAWGGSHSPGHTDGPWPWALSCVTLPQGSPRLNSIKSSMAGCSPSCQLTLFVYWC